MREQYRYRGEWLRCSILIAIPAQVTRETERAVANLLAAQRCRTGRDRTPPNPKEHPHEGNPTRHSRARHREPHGRSRTGQEGSCNAQPDGPQHSSSWHSSHWSTTVGVSDSPIRHLAG